jgi:hypothetical protein
MVRRGSPVRVRKRALQDPRTRGFSFRIELQISERGPGMEPFMEPSGRKGLRNLRWTGTVADARFAPRDDLVLDRSPQDVVELRLALDGASKRLCNREIASIVGVEMVEIQEGSARGIEGGQDLDRYRALFESDAVDEVVEAEG